jgi:hypothetical protein
MSAVSTATLAMRDGVVQLILLLLRIESSLRIKTYQADKAGLCVNRGGGRRCCCTDLTEQQVEDDFVDDRTHGLQLACLFQKLIGVIDIFDECNCWQCVGDTICCRPSCRTEKLTVGGRPLEGDTCPQHCGIFLRSRMTNSSS